MDAVGSLPLTAQFLRLASADVTTSPERAASIEQCLTSMLGTGRAAWADLALSPDEFLRYLADRLPEKAQLPDALTGLNAAELHLACCCALGRPRAHIAFERYCFAALPAVLSRFSSSDEFHDEVRQALRERLFVARPGQRARIEDYSGRGSLVGWVRIAAIRLAIDVLRQRGKEPPSDEDALQTLTIDPDPELRLLTERYRDEVKTAFRDSFAALSAAERNLLRLHHLDGLTIDELSALKRVHRSTIARRIARCCELLATNTHARLVERLGLPPSQVDSVMRLVRSQLELSLERWLGGNTTPRR
jgi:RNA polymerase sigma-70 factor (ECF subfamily)